ncbi:hypothetical protein AALP_AA3G354200 [Arabis alpina]|uniref:Uncharacterized protein n=1 Tax=Arabis alpina TaxID=50452 RepID=A0A087HDS5_ARAAL|nr:hypothetical protein AALP_AA3G354200 [Arabis alpina]
MEQPCVHAYPPGTGPSAPQPPQPVVMIVDPKYCGPDTVDMAIVRKLLKLKSGNFDITDVNGNMLFTVNDPVFGIRDKRILLDGSGYPVLTFREKIRTLHHRWKVFRGGSTDKRNLLYTVKKSSMVQFKTKLNVFLSNNRDEKICDFRVKGTWSEDSCIVYAGETDTIIAQMDKKDTVRSMLFGKDNFLVTVSPNVDYAFIASLIVILDDVNRDAISAFSIAEQILYF